MRKQSFKYQRRNEDVRRQLSLLVRDELEEDRSKPEGRPVNEQNRYDEDEES